MSSPRQIKLGLGQLLVEGGEPERNLNRAIGMVEQAASSGCHVILLPEALDLAWTHPSALTEAQPIPGKWSDLLCEAAKNHSIMVCAGLTEKLKGKTFNTAILINADGEIILKYHKINVLGVGQPYYAIGQQLSVVDTPLGCIGVNICSDNYADGLSIGHTLVRMGAQLILSPSSWTVDYTVDETHDPYEEKWIKPYQHIASLFNVIIAGTTSVGYIVGGPYEGKKMIGCSLLVGPEGIIKRGEFNEFAGDLVFCEFELPEVPPRGTGIGELLQSKGYQYVS